MSAKGIMARIAVILTLLGGTPAAVALWVGDGPETTEHFAGNGRYVLKVVPRQWDEDLGSCKGTLYEVGENSRRMLWKRNLINDDAPVDVYVANSGKSVVTLGAWHGAGWTGSAPVAIYRHEELAGVLNPKQNKFFNSEEVMSFLGRYWYETALVFFGPEDELLFMTLSSGRVVALDLLRGSIAPEEAWEKHKKWVSLRIEKLCLEKLKSADANDRATGAWIAGQRQIKTAIPLLMGLLQDQSSYIQVSDPSIFDRLIGTREREVWPVRWAAVKALHLLRVEVQSVVTEETRRVR